MGRKRLELSEWEEEDWKWEPEEFISSGSTMLNLALSDNPFGGWRVGSFAIIIGNTHSGKSFLVWQTLADVFNNDAFEIYHDNLWYDDAEKSLDFDVEHLFGEKSRLVHLDHQSDSVEDFLDTLRFITVPSGKGKQRKTRPIYVLDSLDPLRTEYEKGRETGKREIPDKPRVLSNELGSAAQAVKENSGLVIIISQSRPNVGVMYGPPERHAGGIAMDFYSKHTVWIHKGKAIEKKGLTIGTMANVRVAKNKVTGKQRSVTFPIINDYGIDDITSIVEYMLSVKAWGNIRETKKGPTGVATHGDFIDGTITSLIKHIEKNDYEDDLKQIVGRVWMERERSAMSTDRKRRY